MRNQKGFTIIELIVVIAIIAVLAAIVLVNVTQYVAKGKNSAIKGNMASLMTNAATYFDENPGKTGSDFVGNSTVGCGTNSPIKNAVTGAGGNLVCYGSTDSESWCATSSLLGNESAQSWCVDSTGYKGYKGSDGCTTSKFTCQ